jgi:hypothetical protein
MRPQSNGSSNPAVPLARPLFLFTLANGAAWIPGEVPLKELPCGFVDQRSLIRYFESGKAPFGYDVTYGLNFVSSSTAVLVVAEGPDCPAVLYMNVKSVSQAWYCLMQLGAPVTSHVQPIVSVATCQSLGLGWAAIALNTPRSETVRRACAFEPEPVSASAGLFLPLT